MCTICASVPFPQVVIITAPLVCLPPASIHPVQQCQSIKNTTVAEHERRRCRFYWCVCEHARACTKRTNSI